MNQEHQPKIQEHQPAIQEHQPVTHEQQVSSSEPKVGSEASVSEVATTTPVKDAEPASAPASAKDDKKSAETVKTPFTDRLFSSNEKVSVPEDYTINFPEGLPDDQVKLLKEGFVKQGFSKEKAQFVVDLTSKAYKEIEAKEEEEHLQRFDRDMERLKKEYGSDFDRAYAEASRFKNEVDLPKDTLEAFVTCIGAYSSFKLFEKLSRTTRDASFAAPPRSQGARAKIDSDESFDNPEFAQKLKAKDAEADKRIKEWAKNQSSLYLDS